MIRRLLKLFTALAILTYGAVIAWFRCNENDLIFSPDATALGQPSPQLGLDSRDVRLLSSDGVQLKARLIPPPPTVATDSAAWLVYLHGASGNIGLPGYNEAWAQFRRRGLGVFAVDYRGYGESQGRISEAGLYRDAEAAYAYVKNTLGIPPSRILLYGFSMGAAVAVELATRVEAAGLMLEGGWLSIPQLGAERYPFLPISLMAQNHFASVDKIARVLMPKLIVHARTDSVIPIAHGRRLFQLATPPKQFYDLGGDHGTSHKVDPSFFTAVGQFIAAQGLPVAELHP